MCQQTIVTDYGPGHGGVQMGGEIRGDLALSVDDPEEFDNEFEEFDEDDFDDDFDDDFEQEIEDDELDEDDFELDVDLDSDRISTIEFEED